TTQKPKKLVCSHKTIAQFIGCSHFGPLVSKPLEEWSQDEVQTWFHQQADLAGFAKEFEGLSGKSIAGLTETQLQKEFGNLRGSVIYNSLQELKLRTGMLISCN